MNPRYRRLVIPGLLVALLIVVVVAALTRYPGVPPGRRGKLVGCLSHSPTAWPGSARCCWTPMGWYVVGRIWSPPGHPATLAPCRAALNCPTFGRADTSSARRTTSPMCTTNVAVGTEAETMVDEMLANLSGVACPQHRGHHPAARHQARRRTGQPRRLRPWTPGESADAGPYYRAKQRLIEPTGPWLAGARHQRPRRPGQAFAAGQAATGGGVLPAAGLGGRRRACRRPAAHASTPTHPCAWSTSAAETPT